MWLSFLYLEIWLWCILLLRYIGSGYLGLIILVVSSSPFLSRKMVEFLISSS